MTIQARFRMIIRWRIRAGARVKILITISINRLALLIMNISDSQYLDRITTLVIAKKAI